MCDMRRAFVAQVTNAQNACALYLNDSLMPLDTLVLRFLHYVLSTDLQTGRTC